jgi:D-alanine-D-alanine ligase
LIGLTYDLREEYLAQGLNPEEVAEYDSPDTVEAIAAALAAAGHQTRAVGSLPRLVQALAAGRRWDLVFNIAEGRGGYGREAQVPALLDYYGIPCTFSDPLTLALTLHKGMAKRVVRDLGLATPAFAVVERPEQAGRVELGWPLFAKPVAEGTGRGVGAASRVENKEELARVCARLLARYGQPVLVEQYLPGRELTVGITGTGPRAQVVAVMEVSLRSQAEPGAYSFRNKEQCERLVRYRRLEGRLALECGELALAAWRGLGCRDAGRVDLRCDARGRPQFLEVNPLAGLHPEHSDLPILCGLAGVGYRELIGRILGSAAERLPDRPAGRAAL